MNATEIVRREAESESTKKSFFVAWKRCEVYEKRFPIAKTVLFERELIFLVSNPCIIIYRNAGRF